MRDEDFFQRIHIIREFTTIKGRLQSEDAELHVKVAKVVAEGDVAGLKALLEKSRGHDSDTYLVTAARKNLQLGAFRMLIEAGEDVRAKCHWNITPLHFSFDVEVSRLLISNGADVHAVEKYGQTPLHLARNEQIAQLFPTDLVNQPHS
jgi:hypothetical protein